MLSTFEVARSELDVIDRQLESVPAAEIVRELALAVDAAEAACSELVNKLISVDQDIEAGERKLAESQSVLTKLLEGRISKILEQEDVERLLVHSSRVRETLDRFRRKVVQHHLVRLEQLILESLSKLMRKDLLIVEVKIDPSTFSVSLRDNALQALEPEQLSAGETPAVCFGFIVGARKSDWTSGADSHRYSAWSARFGASAQFDRALFPRGKPPSNFTFHG